MKKILYGLMVIYIIIAVVYFSISSEDDKVELHSDDVDVTALLRHFRSTSEYLLYFGQDLSNKPKEKIIEEMKDKLYLKIGWKTILIKPTRYIMTRTLSSFPPNILYPRSDGCL